MPSYTPRIGSGQGLSGIATLSSRAGSAISFAGISFGRDGRFRSADAARTMGRDGRGYRRSRRLAGDSTRAAEPIRVGVPRGPNEEAERTVTGGVTPDEASFPFSEVPPPVGGSAGPRAGMPAARDAALRVGRRAGAGRAWRERSGGR